MTEKIGLDEACGIAREFLSFMFGNLNLNSYLIHHAYSVDGGFGVKCSVKPTFNKRIIYVFNITFEGVVESMQLVEEKND